MVENQIEIMKTNCTYESIKDIRYGHGYRGNNRTYKARVGHAKALAFLNALKPSYKALVSVYITKEHKVFLVVVQPAINSDLWSEVENAISLSAKVQEPKPPKQLHMRF